MSKYYYKKAKHHDVRKTARFAGLIMFVAGMVTILYLFFPLLSWQFYLAPVFASQKLAMPVPRSSFIDEDSMRNFLLSNTSPLSGDDLNANTWYPTVKTKSTQLPVASYTISIPTLDIVDAVVSTTDVDLSKHLVHYNGTTLPPDKGTAVIFGHSTIPQFYRPNDYKTIFANLYTIKTGDKIIVKVNGVMYSYKVFRISITEPDDTSMLEQDYDASYLTLITCTPPGTTWKRLVIETKLI